MKYLDVNGIKEAFAKHLMKYRGYDEEEAKMAVSDFPNPYQLPYLFEDYIEMTEIDGVEYEKRASKCDFRPCGVFDLEEFHYYTYYKAEDIQNSLVMEYLSADKLFQVEDLDEGDFDFSTF